MDNHMFAHDVRRAVINHDQLGADSIRGQPVQYEAIEIRY